MPALLAGYQAASSTYFTPFGHAFLMMTLCFRLKCLGKWLHDTALLHFASLKCFFGHAKTYRTYQKVYQASLHNSMQYADRALYGFYQSHYHATSIDYIRKIDYISFITLYLRRHYSLLTSFSWYFSHRHFILGIFIYFIIWDVHRELFPPPLYNDRQLMLGHYWGRHFTRVSRASTLHYYTQGIHFSQSIEWLSNLVKAFDISALFLARLNGYS